MIKVVVASQNPVKLTSAQLGFEKMFPNETFTFEGVKTNSGVNDQPQNDEEAFTGACNRVEHASQLQPDADYWVGQESGIDTFHGDMSAYGWVVIKSKAGKMGKGKTCVFFLPPAVSDLIKQGKELGEADDIVFGRSQSAQANGAVGLLTGDALTRTTYYIDAVAIALVPFKNPTLYP
jgi:inosine/xanthosine triphosphatase